MPRLLLVQTGFLGDAVLSTALIRALHDARPEIEVGLLVRADVADLFRRHPGLYRLHTLNKQRKGATRGMIDEVRAEHYDAALLPHRSIRSAWMMFRARVPRRIGFAVSEAPWMLTDRVPYRIVEHETERNARLLARFGVETGEPSTWLVPDVETRRRMQARLKDESRRVVVIAPGSVWPTKRWTEQGFVGLVQGLVGRGYRAVLAGSRQEAPLCRRIGERSGLAEGDNMAGQLSLVELLALISLAHRVIANDSAPAHIAESIGVPATVIYGPTTPAFGFGPRMPGSAIVESEALECRPCGIHGGPGCPLGHHQCMTRIPANRLIAAIDTW